MKAIIIIALAAILFSSCGNGYKEYKEKRDSLINEIAFIEAELTYPTPKTDKYSLILEQSRLELQLNQLK